MNFEKIIIICIETIKKIVCSEQRKKKNTKTQQPRTVCRFIYYYAMLWVYVCVCVFRHMWCFAYFCMSCGKNVMVLTNYFFTGTAGGGRRFREKHHHHHVIFIHFYSNLFSCVLYIFIHNVKKTCCRWSFRNNSKVSKLFFKKKNKWEDM